MPSWIADETFLFESRGQRWTGRVAIGAPREDEGASTCDLLVETVTSRALAIMGETSLQALLLAVRMAGFLLHSFREQGGRALDPESGEEMPLDAYFGPLLRPPEVVADQVEEEADDADRETETRGVHTRSIVSQIRTPVIADETFRFDDGHGRSWLGRVAIGAPRADQDLVRCDLVCETLTSRVHPVPAASSLQALLIAVQMAGHMLHGFRGQGGRVLDPESGEEMPLEAYFGPLLRSPEADLAELGGADEA